MTSHIRLWCRTVLWLVLAAPVWAGTELAPDPAVRWGQLPNGLRYAIRRNVEPKGRVSVRLGIAAGSLHERDDQRGVAHFLEHMAFNGSKAFPGASMVEFFQRQGMKFGGDTNAFTSFDRTVYQLELPDAAPDRLREAFTFFADVAGGLNLDLHEIDKERGIILSEKRSRDSIASRQSEHEMQFLVPLARHVNRYPIGQEDVIRHAPRERFVDFYDTWYRPELMWVVVVGDCDPAAVEQSVRERFSPLTARAPAQPKPSNGALPASAAPVGSFIEAEASTVRLSLQRLRPYLREPDTAANRLRRLPESLAAAMLNRRMMRLAQETDAKFLSAGAGRTIHFEVAEGGTIAVNALPASWPAALALMEQELRRSLEYGFQASELREVVASFRNSLQESVATSASRRSSDLADEILAAAIDEEVFTDPATDLRVYGTALDQMTLSDCQAAWRALWDPSVPLRLWATGNLTLPGDASAALLSALAESQATPVSRPPDLADQSFAYQNFGTPGRIVHRDTLPELEATTWHFANGVAVNFKRTDFEQGRIRLMVRVGGGRLSEPPNREGVAMYAGSIFIAGGLGKHRFDDLQRQLSGHTLSTSFSIADDAFVFGGATNRRDLLLQLQVICAYLTDPGFRPEAERQAQRSIVPFYQRLAHAVESPLSMEVARLLVNGDSRFGIPAQSALSQRTLDEVKAWLMPELSHGAIEVTVVGDCDEKEAVAAIAATLGALPSRQAKPSYEKQRHVNFAAAPLRRSFAVPTEVARGTVRLVWRADDGCDVARLRQLQLLAEVFADRLRKKIREEMGDTYSPSASANLSTTYRGYGFVTAEAVVEPAQAQRVADAIRAAANALIVEGVTMEELERARRPLLARVKESFRSNGYWVGLLGDAQEYPDRLSWHRDALSGLERITASELVDCARRYLTATAAHEFICVPADLPTPVAAPPAWAPTCP